MLFVTPEIVDKVVEYTNQKAESVYLLWNLIHPSNKRKWIPTNTTEIYGLIGLLVTMGALKAKREPLSMLWTTDPMYKRDLFQASFSRYRFSELLSYVRFDDMSTREERKQKEKFCAFREIFIAFALECRTHYYPCNHLTVDAALVAFRGKCPFWVYMKSKPARYGIKIWAICDVESSYAFNLQVCTGKEKSRL